MTRVPPAWLELDGAVNVRDLGGLPTVDGRTTRTGAVLRSDNLQDLSERDVALLLEQHRLRAVVDLRTRGERHLEGPTPLAGKVAHHELSLIPEPADESDEAEAQRAIEEAIPARPARRNPDDVNDMTGHYLGYVEEAPGAIAAALRVLAEPGPGPALVHCAAGKDRTGVVCALALSLAGVTREAVVADYVASAERVEAILARLQGTRSYGSSLEHVTADQVRPVAPSMERFLDEVDRRYGGAHGLAMSIGLDEETVARLAARLLGGSRA